MLSSEEQIRLLDNFYLHEVLPRLHPQLRALAVDSRVMYHAEEYYELESIIGKIAVVYWTNPWWLADIFPVTPEQCESLAKGVALLFAQYLVSDNIVDGQVPDHPLIPILSQQLGVQAARQFMTILPGNHRFWATYYDGGERFLNGLALGYESLIEHRTKFSPEIMRVIDAGIAHPFRVNCTAMGILSQREALIEPISQIYELMTLADQYGDDAIDWQDDYEAKRATLPIVMLSEAEDMAYDDIFNLSVDEMENLLNKNQILQQMIDYAQEYLREAKALLPQDCHNTWLANFIESRQEDERRRKRNFTAIALLRTLSSRLSHDT